MSWILAAGDLLAHDRVLSPLGSGGTAQVHLAGHVRLRLGRRLALKILSPEPAIAPVLEDPACRGLLRQHEFGA